MKENFLEVHVANSLPVLKIMPTNSSIQKDVNDICFFIKTEKYKLVHDNHYLSGTTLTQDIYEDQFCHNKYKINLLFATQFFELFHILLHKINNTKKSDIYNSLTTSDFTFLLELYNINFQNLFKSLEYIDTKNILIEYALNFKNLNKLKIKDLNLPNESCIKFFNKLCLRIYSYKLIFSNLFAHIDIMRNFKYFQYAWFFCARGRNYSISSVLNIQGLMLARCFVSFQNNLTLNQLKKMANTEIDEIDHALFCQPLEKQINSVCVYTKITAQSNRLSDFIKNYAFLEIKQGNVFNIFIWYNDLINLKNENYQCKGFYSLDSSTSGLQIMAMLWRFKGLAKKVNLTSGSNLSINHEYLSYQDQTFLDIKTLVDQNEKHNVKFEKITTDNFFELLQNVILTSPIEYSMVANYEYLLPKTQYKKLQKFLINKKIKENNLDVLLDTKLLKLKDT